jgi:trimeric autotransporter adhesin
MSTKTTFKRVALVAVAALGFGVLTSVAPATAAESANAEITAVAIATPGSGRIGSAFTSAVTATSASHSVGADVTLRARFDSKPAASAAVVGFNASGLAVAGPSNEAATIYAINAAGNELLPAATKITSSSTAWTDAAQTIGRVGFIPDVAGAYVVTVWHDTDKDGQIGTGEVYSTKTFTVGNAPASVSVTKINGTAAAGTAGSGNGALVKLSLLDSAGLAAGLASNESIVLTPSSGYDVTAVNGTDPSVATSAAATLVAANFIGGVAWVNLTGPAGTGTFTISATGSGIDTITGVFTISFKTVVTGTTATTVHGDAVTSAYGAGLATGGTITTATMPLGANTVSYTTTASTGFATGDYALATITDSNGRVTGSSTQSVTGLKYDLAYVLTEIAAASTTKTGSFSVSVSSSTTATQGFNVVTSAGTAINSGVTAAATSLTSSSGSLAITPSSALALKSAGSITYTVTLKDQFGVAQPNVTVTLSGGTRNAVSAATAAPTAVTNVSGQATFTITDKPSATAIAAAYTTDTFTFTATGGTTVNSGLITWSATGPVVGTVTVLGGNNGTTTGVASSSPNVKDIAAGDGAEAGVQPFTATVKDAAGNLLAGVPVTFTISGTGTAITSTTQTVYTGAAGTATAQAYAWVEGTYTVTATAGGIAGTAGFTVAQQTATEARAISATVSGTIVTSKVVDRFGNAVPGVTVYATKTGTGFFGTGVTSTSAVTNTAGIAEFVIAGGDADVTVSTLDPNAAAGTKAFGQTCAAATFIGCSSTSVALTAATAGTSLKDEAGVGASLSAAGVSSAKVSVVGDSSAQQAADAAAEATDAANAATDAANAAAEAADAATAAAQDAADAVAALSMMVNEQIADLKAMNMALQKQITALTNLIIKIQKKVKA